MAVASAGALHARSHPPQRLGSAPTSTHALPHAKRPASQENAQPPDVHDGVPPIGAVQAEEQLPQCSTLIATSMHAASDSPSPRGQPSAQSPSAHTLPTPLTTLLLPQSAG